MEVLNLKIDLQNPADGSFENLLSRYGFEFCPKAYCISYKKNTSCRKADIDINARKLKLVQLFKKTLTLFTKKTQIRKIFPKTFVYDEISISFLLCFA